MQPARVIFEEEKHRYFFAIRPTAEAIARIDDVSPLPLRGETIIAGDRRHMTMFMLGDFDRAPESLLSRARDAASSLAMKPFGLLLDQLTYGLHSGMLMPSESLPGLEAFRRGLRDALGRAGIKPPHWWHYGAHMTLLYGQRPGGSVSIEPVSWRVEEFALIHSLIGGGRHNVVDRWSLRA